MLSPLSVKPELMQAKVSLSKIVKQPPSESSATHLVVGGADADSHGYMQTPTVNFIKETAERETSMVPDESIHLESRPIAAGLLGTRERASVSSIESAVRPKVSIKYRERRNVVQLSSSDYVSAKAPKKRDVLDSKYKTAAAGGKKASKGQRRGSRRLSAAYSHLDSAALSSHRLENNNDDL